MLCNLFLFSLKKDISTGYGLCDNSYPFIGIQSEFRTRHLHNRIVLLGIQNESFTLLIIERLSNACKKII